jgi:hypothetical protein
MKKVYLLLILSVTFSCKTSFVKERIVGTYKVVEKNFFYQLVLNKDNTFDFKFSPLESISGCDGKWYVEDKSSLILLCNEPKSFNETLQRGYMTTRRLLLEIKNENELKYGDLILIKDRSNVYSIKTP